MPTLKGGYGKAQRTKGHNFEREVARTFRSLFPKSYRVLEYQSNNANGIDVEAGPFNIQCKRSAKSVPMNKINEIKPDENKIPLLVSKVDRQDAMVTIKLDDFMRLCGLFYRAGSERES